MHGTPPVGVDNFMKYLSIRRCLTLMAINEKQSSIYTEKEAE